MRRALGGTAIRASLVAGLFLFASPLSSPTAADPRPIPEDARTWAQVELAGRLVAGRGVRQNAPAAAILVERLAETGNALAQTIIGTYYLNGIGVERNPELAARWLQQAAAQNYGTAQGELAYLYLRGVGVTQDYGRGRALARAAAERGDSSGEDAMGLIYANGWGIESDAGDAFKWFKRSADHGNWAGMFHLGELYRDGKGVTADRVVAYAWFELAASFGLAGVGRVVASKSRDETALVLLPADLALARQLAAEWRPGVDLAAKRANAGPARVVDATPAPVNTAPPPQAPARVSDTPVVMKRLTLDYDVLADGSFVRLVHTELQPKNDAAAKDFAQQPVGFSEALEQVEVLEAYTLKPDGRRLPVNPASIQTRLAPGAQSVPMFDDRKQKVILYPVAEAGDVLVATMRYTAKPLIPGFFAISIPFDRTLLAEDVRVTVKAPRTMPLLTETHEIKFEQKVEGEKTVYEWRFSNPNPLPENTLLLDSLDRSPRLFASSFKNYEQLAAAFAAMVGGKSVVTPAIRKLADEITSGVSDKRKQMELIYGWVSRHIRYVALEIGLDSLMPHAADAVLSNGYGDCKDHAVLFSALLKAKNIPSATVLINLGASYSLPSAPTFGTLNHAITWLPDLSLYVDTTAGVAPFGVLPFEEYGKPVVLAMAAPSVVQRTPPLPGNAASLALKTTAHLDKDGRIVGDSESIASGPFAVLLRQIATSIQSSGQEQAARYILRSKGYDGSGRLEFASPYDAGSTYRVAGHFETASRAEMLSGNSFYLPIGLALGPRPGDFLVGPLIYHGPIGEEPTPCFSGRQQEELSLELPEGKSLRELPKGVEIKNKYLRYKSEWSLSGRTVKVRREFSSAVDQPVCIGDVRREAAKALNEIRADYNKALALAGP